MADVKFTDNSKEVLSALEKGIKNALTAIGEQAVSYAKKEEIAVDTGRLRNSITYATSEYSGVGSYSDDKRQSYDDAVAHGTPKKDEVYIGTNVVYAAGIELGTHRKAGAVHFLQKAVTQHSDEYKKITEAALKAAGG